MAKKFIKFALVRNVYGREYRVLGVTTVRGWQAYGRWFDNDVSTHVSERDVVHYFTEIEEARAAIGRIAAAEEHHRPLVAAARENLNAAEQARRVAIKAAAVKKENDQ